MDLISVIVPVYNVEKYLKRCLDSILDQSYDNIEVVLVDDGSTDQSGSICDEYSSKFENVRTIHKENGGLGSARNTGMKHMSGKYLTFVDSDDSISREHIHNLYSSLIQHRADACYGGHTKVLRKKRIVYPNYYSGRCFTDDDIRRSVIPCLCGQTGSYGDSIEMSVCMAMYSTDIIWSNNLRFVSEREFVSEDMIFNFAYLCHAKRICVSHDVGYYYFFNKESLSHAYLADRFEKSRIMKHEVSKMTKGIGVYELCEQRIKNQFVISARVCLQAEVNAWRKNGAQKAFKKFKKYIDDIELQETVNSYDQSNVRIQARLLNYLIKHKMYRILWIVMSARSILGILGGWQI